MTSLVCKPGNGACLAAPTFGKANGKLSFWLCQRIPPLTHRSSRKSRQCARASFSQRDMENLVLEQQEAICDVASRADGSGLKFITDRWERNASDPNAGFGITRVLEGGDLLEKAAANVTVVRGVLSEERAKAMNARNASAASMAAPGDPYFACALSLVFHTRSPMVPTFRSDVRYFEVDGKIATFGGGADLTPYYLFEEDAVAFHSFWKGVCDKHDPSIYPAAKETCDKYFYIPARKEYRGTGGIFFDGMTDIKGNVAAAFAFTADVARGFMPSFLPIAHQRRALPYSEQQRQWQLIRRGRYLEFNLLYDRGVRFGLDGGRIESIMVSAPPLIAWKYNFTPAPGSEEAKLMEVLKAPRKWV
eukprot:jgi/Mesvir1/1601/Mv14566-RA.1